MYFVHSKERTNQKNNIVIGGAGSYWITRVWIIRPSTVSQATPRSCDLAFRAFQSSLRVASDDGSCDSTGAWHICCCPILDCMYLSIQIWRGMRQKMLLASLPRSSFLPLATEIGRNQFCWAMPSYAVDLNCILKLLHFLGLQLDWKLLLL